MMQMLKANQAQSHRMMEQHQIPVLSQKDRSSHFQIVLLFYAYK